MPETATIDNTDIQFTVPVQPKINLVSSQRPKQYDATSDSPSYESRFATAGSPFSSRPATYKAFTLQEWEGFVIEVQNERFWARLLDVTSTNIDVEGQEAEFSIHDVGIYEQKKIREGAIFRWVIERQTEPCGTVNTVSRIVFRDLPRFSHANTPKKTSIEELTWEHMEA